MVTTVLFDLDGTLLPMDQEVFVKSYFKRLAASLAPYDFLPADLVQTVGKGTYAMTQNDGKMSNEDLFWSYAAHCCGTDVKAHLPLFDAFYRTQFQQIAEDCGYTPDSRKLIDTLKSAGFRMVLATNPIFPSIATESRIRWAGLEPADFELITTYENSRYCKPNPAYYQDILDAIGCKAEECVMVGNDVSDDMPAETLGMRVFLLTDCLINRNNVDISRWPNGGFDALTSYLMALKQD